MKFGGKLVPFSIFVGAAPGFNEAADEVRRKEEVAEGIAKEVLRGFNEAADEVRRKGTLRAEVALMRARLQ